MSGEMNSHPGGVSCRVLLQPMPDGSHCILLMPAPHVSVLLPLTLAEGVVKAIQHCLDKAAEIKLMAAPASNLLTA